MTNFLNRIPLAVRQQAKAFLGGAVAAVVAAEAPLVQGGTWTINTLYAAAVSAVVAYLGVYLTGNAPKDLTTLERLLASLVGQVAQPAGTPTAVVTAPPLPEPVAAPTTPAPAVDFSAVTPVNLTAPTVVVTPTRPPSPVPVGNTVAYAGPVPPVSEPVGATAAPAS